MDAHVLIDSIVRQTTVLIAQLSSAAGVRAPLAHVADEVFLNLSRELEQQGLSRKVVADMFGLALRGYQRRVQRLSESSSQRGTTLWQAVLDFVDQQSPVTRKRVFERFQYDDAPAVAATLGDLKSSGLVAQKGQGDSAVFELTAEHERAALAKQGKLETSAAIVWLELCRTPTASPLEIAARLAFSEEQVDDAIEHLLQEGRIGREGAQLVVAPMVVPVGAEAGWEAAVFDHYQTMCIALGAKLSRGQSRARAGDTTGGQTVSFDIDDEHPEREAVLGLLERTRGEVNALWERVQAHNAAHPQQDRRRVSFYLGQVEIHEEQEA